MLSLSLLFHSVLLPQFVALSSRITCVRVVVEELSVNIATAIKSQGACGAFSVCVCVCTLCLLLEF